MFRRFSSSSSERNSNSFSYFNKKKCLFFLRSETRSHTADGLRRGQTVCVGQCGGPGEPVPRRSGGVLVAVAAAAAAEKSARRPRQYGQWCCVRRIRARVHLSIRTDDERRRDHRETDTCASKERKTDFFQNRNVFLRREELTIARFDYLKYFLRSITIMVRTTV